MKNQVKEEVKFRLHYRTKTEKEPRKWKPSLTVPDKTYTVNEIIERCKVGNMPDVIRNPDYLEEGTILRQSVDPLTQSEDSILRLQQRIDTLNRKKNETPKIETKGGTGEGVEPAPEQ